MPRKYIDCRDMPQSNCSLKISGETEEVVKAGSEHAVSAHGQKPGPELQSQIRASLKDEVEAVREKPEARASA